MENRRSWQRCQTECAARFRNVPLAPLSVPPKDLYQGQCVQKSWLKSRGKERFISFSDEALHQLRSYFNSLDASQCGSIGIEELQDPFIAFGLSDNREQVQKLIKAVDLDGSGRIEFDEFLAIMVKVKSGKTANSAIFQFFNKMTKGQLDQGIDKKLSFRLNVSQFRRKKLLEAMVGPTKEHKENGIKILNNFKRQVIRQDGLRDLLEQSKRKPLSLNCFFGKRNSLA